MQETIEKVKKALAGYQYYDLELVEHKYSNRIRVHVINPPRGLIYEIMHAAYPLPVDLFYAKCLP